MIIKTDLDQIASYLEDTANIKGNAQKLYLPATALETAQAVKECLKNKMPFTISAGRTGTTAGCVPLSGAVISVENLKDLEIDLKDLTAKAGAGVLLNELERSAGKQGLAFRPAPTESLASISGSIANNACGTRGFGYGSIRQYVKLLEIVLPSGDIVNIERGKIYADGRVFNFELGGRRFKFELPGYQMPQVKSQAGYYAADDMDLIDLFIGSEGTLGVITQAALSLQKIPFKIFDGLVFWDNELKAFDFCQKVKQLNAQGDLSPASLEFMDANSLAMLRPHYDFVPLIAEAAVYFEQEEEAQDEEGLLLVKWSKLIAESKALDKSFIADAVSSRQKIFDFRHKLPQLINEFLRAHGQVKAALDCAVPEQHFRKMYDFYKQKGNQSGIDYLNFGHIGQDHLHFNFLPKDKREADKAKEFMMDICRKAIEFGGTISAEHGIGKRKKEYLKLMYTQKDIDQMKKLKKYFDPAGLMGQGNIF